MDDSRTSSAGEPAQPVGRVRAIERAFVVLQRLAVGPAGLTEISEMTGLPKSTSVRILATLEHVGAVQRDPAGRYVIGPGIEELVRFRDSGATTTMTVRPHLVTLSAEVGEAVGFGIQVGSMVHHLVQAQADVTIQVKDYTGHSVPLHVSPAGVVILAHMADDAVDAYLADDLAAYTSRTVVDPVAIRERLAKTRDEGHTWSLGEFAEDLNSVAAPVHGGDGRLLGAVSIHGPAYRFPAERRSAITDALVAAAGRLTRAASHQMTLADGGAPAPRVE